MRMRIAHRSLALAALSFAAGCSGGVSGPTPFHAAQSSPTTAASSQPGGDARPTAQFVITLPDRTSAKQYARANERKPAYISPATSGAIVTATSSAHASNDVTEGYDLSGSAGSSCTTNAGGSRTCTLDLGLAPGSYSVTIATYDQSERGYVSGAPAGNELSVDTENETVVANTSNSFANFVLHAVVVAFHVAGPSAGGTSFTGATGGSALGSPAPSDLFQALDADFYAIDQYGGATTYENGPFVVAVSDNGDTTGCTTPCASASNVNGTSPGSTPAKITQPSDETLQLGYTGGGGPGAGIENSGGGAAPAGGSQRPYYGKITVQAGTNAPNSALIVPLFAYPSSISETGGTFYVWAAQAAPPNGANYTTGSYAAYFGTPGTTTCVDTTGDATNGQTIATVGSGTYEAGYGAVFAVTPGVAGSCTLTLSDGGSPADTVTSSITIQSSSTTVTIPEPCPTQTPTGSGFLRTHAVARSTSGSRRRFASGPATTLFASDDNADVHSYALAGFTPQTEYAQTAAYAVAIDSLHGVLYAGDGNAGDFSVFTIGNGTATQNINAGDSNPQLAVDGNTCSLFVSRPFGGSVLVYNTGELTGTPATVQGLDPSSNPYSLAVDTKSQLLFVGEYSGGTIKVYKEGNYTTPVTSIGGLNYPDTMAVDPVHGMLYVTENYSAPGANGNPQILIYNESNLAAAPSVLPQPVQKFAAIAVDGVGGNLFVADLANQAVDEYPLGNLSAAPTVLPLNFAPYGLGVL